MSDGIPGDFEETAGVAGQREMPCYIQSLPWYKKDKYGWPIETVKNKPLFNMLRIFFQNIRKLPVCWWVEQPPHWHKTTWGNVIRGYHKGQKIKLWGI